ncbi:MAG TPA: SpoIID/LytB domain-containing protein [Terriglobales bacterium]|jgi:stage II sporulation protein D|nr:SpoIID/LytB domain-containing protein [Terriglobales bacterium]
MRCACALLVVLVGSSALAQDIRIGVFSLFHPSELTVGPGSGNAVVARADQQSLILDSGSLSHRIMIRAENSVIEIRSGSQLLLTHEVTFTSRTGGPVEFVLSVPGKIARRYRGRLCVSNVSSELVPVVTMDLETAVASVVAAETIGKEPPAALQAQAVATRSYFLAGKGRHRDFDFCDTTHCQFLRSPPAPKAPAFEATAATRGLVLKFRSQAFAAMYTRSCSGRTRTPADVGLAPGNYPYYPVECLYCRRHPNRWHTRISSPDAAKLRPSDEPSRLKATRTLGWDSIPSNDFTMRQEGAQALLDGVGQGHGIGLCQSGARAMAEHGANFREILAHYYPNTEVVAQP